jgi:hypothetical protein
VSGYVNDVSCFDEMSYAIHVLPVYKYLLSALCDAVPGKRYAMSEPGHVLSAICYEMSKRRNLFSGRLHDMSCH